MKKAHKIFRKLRKQFFKIPDDNHDKKCIFTIHKDGSLVKCGKPAKYYCIYGYGEHIFLCETHFKGMPELRYKHE